MTVNLAAGPSAASLSRVAAVWPVLRLAAPLTGFFFVQSVTNLVGLAFLGRVGDAALAGTGAASAIYGVLLALMYGIDAAAQATASRATGAGQVGQLGKIAINAQAVALPLGAVLATALTLWGGPLLKAILGDPASTAAGTAYLRAAAPSLVASSLTIPINSCWIASGRPGRSFLVNVILAPVQIAATYCLVLGQFGAPAMGAAGAGAAITVSCLAGMGLQLFLALHRQAIPGYLRRAPDLRGMASIVAIGWPVSLQQSLNQLGLMVAFIIVGRLGTSSVAAINVLISLATVTAQLAGAVGAAAGTLVGQALGRGDAGEARTWGWRAVGVGVAVTGPMGLIAAVAPHAVLSLFLHDPTTLAIAEWPARLLGLGVAADSLGQVLCFAIRGAGATRIGAGIPFVRQILLQLPLTWWVAVSLGWGLLGMIGLQLVMTLAEALVTTWFWAGSRWTTPSGFRA